MNAIAGTLAFHSLQTVPIQDVTIDDEFWAPRRETWRSVTIPYCFDRFEADGALANFERAAAHLSGGHRGRPWYDGLVYEMIRACGDFLAACRDSELEARIDGYVERIAAAQEPDGYINTYTQLMAPGWRWGMNGGDDLWQHDLYNAGALVEAAVHYYRGTGKVRLLEIAVRLADHLCDTIGASPKVNAIPGHSLPEEAFVDLYRLLRDTPSLKSSLLSEPREEERYLRLAEFWIENRGNHAGRLGSVTDWGPYAQDHLPVLQQETIEGHAVRATLLCTGLVAAAIENRRPDYLAAASRLWRNMVTRRMYVTGGVGAKYAGESFGGDYILPNDGYLETCAAVGAAFFHQKLNLACGEARYVDELERALYNGILGGVSLAGDEFSYTNPLEGSLQSRWRWHTCPCCPPMLLKILAALPGYIYASDDAGLYVNLFVGGRVELQLAGQTVRVQQTTRYPWDGHVELRIEPERAGGFAVNLRVPGWSQSAQVTVNGLPAEDLQIVRGYLRLPGPWQPGDTISLDLPMPARRLKAHPLVAADRDRTALARGPLIYCLEDVDHPVDVVNLALPGGRSLAVEHRPDLLEGVTVIRGLARGTVAAAWPDRLYVPDAETLGPSDIPFTAIPFYANGNRQAGHMAVWIRETMPPPFGL